MADQKKDFEFYLQHKEEFLKQYAGLYIVIKDCQVLGAYKTPLEAVEETKKTHALGTFIVQHVTPLGDQVTFRSRYAG